jgi:hypothetical protein
MTPSYKTHDPKGWCGDPQRGAALGRHAHKPADTPMPAKEKSGFKT